MFSNRIARFSASFPSSVAPAHRALAAVPAAPTFGAANAQAANAQAMVLMPSVSLASWQEQVYRLAYQKALVDTAPPRHFARFFSVWN
jgi:hypothetical protein